MTLFLIIVAALAIFLFWVSRKPGAFSLARSTTIVAPPSQIFPLINNLKAMNTWNPWAAADARSKITYEGPDEGPGAIYRWAGGKMGEGRFEITDVKEPMQVGCRLTMIKPMAAENRVEFTLAPTSQGTEVTWTMSGKSGFVPKLMHTFFSMEKMVGGQFEAGLAKLKQIAEESRLR